MPSKTRKPGAVARPSEPSASSLNRPVDGGAADIALSAAFRSVLGTRASDAHLPAPALKQGQEIARLAKAAQPARPSARGNAQAAHIGPRSGHK